MKRYLYVLVLMFPLSLVAQVEKDSQGFDGAFEEDYGLKEKNPMDDEVKAFQNVVKDFHFMFGIISKEEGTWDFTFSNKSIMWGDYLFTKRSKQILAKKAKALSEKIFAHIEEMQKDNADFQYDFVLWKHGQGYTAYVIEIQEKSRLFCQ